MFRYAVFSVRGVWRGGMGKTNGYAGFVRFSLEGGLASSPESRFAGRENLFRRSDLVPNWLCGRMVFPKKFCGWEKKAYLRG